MTKKLPGPAFRKAGVCAGAVGMALGFVKTAKDLFTRSQSNMALSLKSGSRNWR